LSAHGKPNLKLIEELQKLEEDLEQQGGEEELAAA